MSSRSAHCCPPARAAWCWLPAAVGWPEWPRPRARASSRWMCWPRPRLATCWTAGWAAEGWRPSPALAVIAARAQARPGLPLAELAAELRDEQGRLAALDAGDPATSVQAAFSWSYRQLTPAAAGMFRLLGLAPGTDITAHAAASLAGVPLQRARGLLAELTQAHLLTEHVADRYNFHDLLRAYAAELAQLHDPQPDRHTALTRLFDYYLATD